MESSPDAQKLSYVVSTNTVGFFEFLRKSLKDGTCKALASMISVMSET